MKQYIVALMLACSIQGHSQDVKQATFGPPFDTDSERQLRRNPG